jgi:hypothetical protein
MGMSHTQIFLITNMDFIQGNHLKGPKRCYLTDSENIKVIDAPVISGLDGYQYINFDLDDQTLICIPGGYSQDEIRPIAKDAAFAVSTGKYSKVLIGTFGSSEVTYKVE